MGRGDATRIKIDDIGTDKPHTSTSSPAATATTGGNKDEQGKYAAVAAGDSSESSGTAIGGGDGLELVALDAGEANLVNRSVKTLHDITFQIKKGELVLVLGG